MNNNSKGDYNSKLVTPEEVIKGIEDAKGPLTEELKRAVIDKVNSENKKLTKSNTKKVAMTVEEVIAKIEANTGTVLTEEQRRIVRDKVNSENKSIEKKPVNLEFFDVSEPTLTKKKDVNNKVTLTPEEVIKEIEKNKGVVLTEEQKRMVVDKLNFENKKPTEVKKDNANMTVEEVIAKVEANTGTTLTEEQKRIVKDKVNSENKKDTKKVEDFIESSEENKNSLLTDEDINSLASALDKHNTDVVTSQLKEMKQLKITPEEVIAEIEKNNGVKLTEELKRIVIDKVNRENGNISVKNSNEEISKIKEAIYIKIGELQNNTDNDSKPEDLSELYKACEMLTKLGLEFSLPQKVQLKKMGIDIEKALGTETYNMNNIRYYYGENPIYDQYGNKINISIPIEN